MDFPDDRRYTKEHEWIKLEDETTIVIGISDFAQGELGDVVFVELEDEGSELGEGEVFGTVEAVKTVSDLFMPVSGTIAAVNESLDATPEVVNDSPYEHGWMIKVTIDDSSALAGLMTAAEYADMVGG
ncbi:MAG: glycine cleavage system protein GcvH [Rhodothermia bacterium]